MLSGISLYLTIIPITLHFICICLQNVRILLSCNHQVLTGHIWIKIYQEHGQLGVAFFFPPFDARGRALTIPEAAHIEIEYIYRLLTPSNSTLDPVKFKKASPLHVLSVKDHTSSQGKYSHPHILWINILYLRKNILWGKASVRTFHTVHYQSYTCLGGLSMAMRFAYYVERRIPLQILQGSFIFLLELSSRYACNFQFHLIRTWFGSDC